MKILLDTHAFLWWITDDPRLSSRARKIISNIENELFLSAASGWEISIKTQLGRLKLPDEPEHFIPEQMRVNSIQTLPIKMSHALHVSSLPNLHRDPFDRILIAQAQLEKMAILSPDLQMSDYEVELIW